MAGVDPRLNKALKSFLSEWRAHKSANLTLKSVKGELSVTLNMRLGYHGEKPEAGRGYQNLQWTQVGPSQLCRREHRAFDPVIQQKAAEHAASVAAFHSPTPAEQAVGVTAGQAVVEEAASATGEQAAPVVGESAAGQAAAPTHLTVPPPSSPPSTFPPCVSPSLTSPPPTSPLLREGFNKKNTSFYPHLVDKGGGSADVDNYFFL